MSVFTKGKWIWIGDGGAADEYAEFTDTFSYAGGEAVLRLSVDGDYTLYVNGSYVAANQYGDFEHYKNYDELNLTPYLSRGENRIYLLVWHFGMPSMRYRPAAAGAIFEMTAGGEVILHSGAHTPARKSRCYQSGRCKNITAQLGLGFLYDANGEDATGLGFSRAVLVDKTCRFVRRTGEKLALGEEKKLRSVKKVCDNHYLIDLGEETVGIPVLRFFSAERQRVLIAWGEHIEDGGVRRLIGNRDFSFEYIAKPGKNDYTNYMLRLGLRYLEVFAEKPIEVDYIGVRPQFYPTKRRQVALADQRDRAIYDLCVRTLELSMMEHYVDCPWREQCLYIFDSRNQMLCGYYAFENGNAEYVKANLKLILQDTREDGLFSITYPSGEALAIPSFSLHLYTSLREYYAHTGDGGLIREAYPKLSSVMEVFVRHCEDGLFKKFGNRECWNFYDWSDNLSGTLGRSEQEIPDLVGNCLLIKALENFRYLSEMIGAEFAYGELEKTLRMRVRATFFDAEEGLFVHTEGGTAYTALGNALAILCGLCDREEARRICRAIRQGEVSACSLSMKPFVYDALLLVDAAYKEDILNEIRACYGRMLDAGATSAWETAKGAEDFDRAGSLCHGWSSIPVYYYHTLGMCGDR